MLLGRHRLASAVEALAGGGPLLLNMWGTTCANCIREFGDFKKHAQDLEDAGLRIATLTTDKPEDHDTAKKMLARFGLSDRAGYADAEFLETLEVLLASIVGQTGGREAWPLPMSLLLDEQVSPQELRELLE